MNRPILDLVLYLVLDPLLVGPRGLETVLRVALAGGVTAVQLRDKHASRAQFLEQARQLQAVLRGSGVPLIINDRVDVAVEVGADGVHVGQGDMAVSEVRRLLGPRPLVGLSVSRASEVDEANSPLVDYIGLGPIFPTETKLDTPAALGLDAVRSFTSRLSLPVVAIGGIHVGNATSVIEAGADGVAVVSAICAAPDPELAARALRHAVARGHLPPRRVAP